MYVILVYDIKEKRVNKILKTCRKYLTWIQNSVFEGEITIAKLDKLKIELNKIIVPNEDSIIIYEMRDFRYNTREILGVEKGNTDNFL